MSNISSPIEIITADRIFSMAAGIGGRTNVSRYSELEEDELHAELGSVVDRLTPVGEKRLARRTILPGEIGPLIVTAEVERKIHDDEGWDDEPSAPSDPAIGPWHRLGITAPLRIAGHDVVFRQTIRFEAATYASGDKELSADYDFEIPGRPAVYTTRQGHRSKKKILLVEGKNNERVSNELDSLYHPILREACGALLEMAKIIDPGSMKPINSKRS